MYNTDLLLCCLWKRRKTVVELPVAQARRNICSPLPMQGKSPQQKSTWLLWQISSFSFSPLDQKAIRDPVRNFARWRIHTSWQTTWPLWTKSRFYPDQSCPKDFRTASSLRWKVMETMNASCNNWGWTMLLCHCTYVCYLHSHHELLDVHGVEICIDAVVSEVVGSRVEAAGHGVGSGTHSQLETRATALSLKCQLQRRLGIVVVVERRWRDVRWGQQIPLMGESRIPTRRFQTREQDAGVLLHGCSHTGRHFCVAERRLLCCSVWRGCSGLQGWLVSNLNMAAHSTVTTAVCAPRVGRVSRTEQFVVEPRLVGRRRLQQIQANLRSGWAIVEWKEPLELAVQAQVEITQRARFTSVGVQNFPHWPEAWHRHLVAWTHSVSRHHWL